jgi:hypothetical protein
VQLNHSGGQREYDLKRLGNNYPYTTVDGQIYRRWNMEMTNYPKVIKWRSKYLEASRLSALQDADLYFWVKCEGVSSFEPLVNKDDGVFPNGIHTLRHAP